MSDWEFDPWIILPLAASAALYGYGIVRLWKRAGIGKGVRRWQALSFFAGWTTLVGALVSPLHEWSEHLFSAHMIEHELLMAVAAPFLCAARPIGALLAGMPRSLRRVLIRFGHITPVKLGWRWCMVPTVATILHAVAIWAWHIPALLDGTLVHEWMHRLQHVSFLGTALIFWWSILRRPRREYGAGALHIFATMMHMSLLGALLALSPRVYYPLQCAGASSFGLSPLEDQQLAGLIMWIPAGTLYMAAGLGAIALWLTSGNPKAPRAVLV